MYCSICKLKVTDETMENCPVCRGPLQPESMEQEASEPLELKEAEPFDLAREMLADFDGEVKFDAKSDEISLDDGPAFDSRLDLEALELDEASPEQADRKDVDDIRVLADLWAKEDSATDLEGVLAETFSAEKSTLVEEPVVITEPDRPVSSVSAASVVDSGKRSLPWLPLLLVAGLILGVGGGWYYFSKTSKSAETETKAVVVDNNSGAPQEVDHQAAPLSEDKAAETAKEAKETAGAEVVFKVADYEKSESEADVSAEASRSSLPPVAENRIDRVVAAASGPVQIVAAGSKPVAEMTKHVVADTEAAAKSLVNTGNNVGIVSGNGSRMRSAGGVSVSTPADVTASPSATWPAVSAGAVKNGLASGAKRPSQSQTASSPVRTAKGYGYVVHIGSFRTSVGAERQLAKLRKKGFAAYKTEVDLGEKGIWQRIFVPGGVSKGDAERVQNKLKKLLPHEASLIRKIKK